MANVRFRSEAITQKLLRIFFSGNVFDLSRYFCLRLSKREQIRFIVTTTPIHMETLVSKNQCIQSKVIDVLSDPCWHPFQTIPYSDEGKTAEKSK